MYTPNLTHDELQRMLRNTPNDTALLRELEVRRDDPYYVAHRGTSHHSLRSKIAYAQRECGL